jgi:hypothetical protein
MALSSSRLATDMVNRWKANGSIGFSSPLSTAQNAIIQALADGIAQAFVAEVTSNGVVSTTGADPQGGTVTSTGTVS